MHPVARTLAVTAALGAGTLAYSLWEAQSFRLRRLTAPVLPAGSGPLTVLHISDLHLTPNQHRKRAWVASLADLEPDLVVITGDFISNAPAVATIAETLDPLLHRPGVFVFGSNDYYNAQLKNPLRYLNKPSTLGPRKPNLPTEELRAELTHGGWLDLNNRSGEVQVGPTRVSFIGVDDPHIKRDRLDLVEGCFDSQADLRVGVAHAPYLRVLDGMAAEGADLILAGHTHGGQVCVPGFGALVTNCDLPRSQASGLFDHKDCLVHVSAGVGTNPYTPIRLACPPEATLLTLTGR